MEGKLEYQKDYERNVKDVSAKLNNFKKLHDKYKYVEDELNKIEKENGVLSGKYRIVTD